jgi:hypothetical protein
MEEKKTVECYKILMNLKAKASDFEKRARARVCVYIYIYTRPNAP